MSEKPSRLGKADSTLVLDASAVINVLGTSQAAALLGALGRTCVVEATAWREVTRDPLTGKSASGPLKALIDRRLLLKQEMNSETALTFLELVLAQPPDGLDDGEAATVAHAAAIGGSAVIDERKALRVCTVRLPTVRLLSTMDLLTHSSVSRALGQAALSDAVFSALQHARMRVLPEFAPWVVELLGPDRAAKCPSLNRYLE